MPALRNSVLCWPIQNVSCSSVPGKRLLAVEIKREAPHCRLDVNQARGGEPARAPRSDEAEEGKDLRRCRGNRAPGQSQEESRFAQPIHNVHFSTFIINEPVRGHPSAPNAKPSANG
jgi:hypothetical protein